MINIVYLLDVLQNKVGLRLDRINQNRVDQLKPYINNIDCRVFIYGNFTPSGLMDNNIIETQLKRLGLKSDQICLYSNPDEKAVCLQRGTEYFADKERKNEDVIVVGSSKDRYIHDWVQDNDYSIVDWPYGSKDMLAELIGKQLYIPGNNSDLSIPEFANGSTILPADVPDFKRLVEEILALRDDIFNLSRTITGFELDQRRIEHMQIHLIKLLLQSENEQTRLIGVLLDHHPIEYAVIGLTGFHIAITIALFIIEQCCNHYKERAVEKSTQINGFVNQNQRGVPLVDMGEEVLETRSSTQPIVELPLLVRERKGEKKTEKRQLSALFKKEPILYRSEMRTAVNESEGAPLLAGFSARYSSTTKI